jgi:hypothetical protein
MATLSLKASELELNLIFPLSTASSMLREAFTRPSIRMEPMGNGRTGRGDSGGSFGNHRLRE